jgi:hypothetical protein
MQNLIENALGAINETLVEAAQENSHEVCGQMVHAAWPMTC